MSWRCLAAALMCVGVWSEEPASALRLAADSPELSAMGVRWAERWDTLRIALISDQADQRRGAARIAAVLPELPSGNALLEALVQSKDAEAQRLAFPALMRQLDTLKPADLLTLDPPLACLLLQRHPTKDPLADRQVKAALGTWLRDADQCLPAAELVLARGDAHAWGDALIACLTAGNADVVANAHQTLCVLTKTQRSLDVYAGHVDLLVKDWKDTLAKNIVAPGTVSNELLALVAELPAETALITLLGRGAEGLAAVEQGMAGAERARRRELEATARLLTRAVTPALWKDLGAAGLADCDASTPRARLAALSRAAEAVVRLGDGPGLMHLLSYCDDADPLVRIAAFDRLVRISDDKRRFTGDWKLADAALFPPNQVVWRLRNALAKGAADEQVSAMQFAAAIEANLVSDDVAGLLFSPHSVVVDTALETIGHLDAEGHLDPLVRLAADARNPPARRAHALEVVAKNGKEKIGSASAKLLETVAAEGGLVGAAAQKTRLKVCKSDMARYALFTALLGGSHGDRLAAITALADGWADEPRSGEGKPYAQLAVPLVSDPDPTLARPAASTLLTAYAQAKFRQQVPGWFSAEARNALLESLAKNDPSLAQRTALAYSLGLIPVERLYELAHDTPVADLPLLGNSLIITAPDAGTAISQTQRLFADRKMPDHVLYLLLNRASLAIALDPAVLVEILATANIEAIPNEDTDSDYNGGKQVKKFLLAGGKTLRLVAVSKSQEHMSDDHDSTWSIDGVAPLDSPASAVIDALDTLVLDEDHKRWRSLLTAAVRHTTLPPGDEKYLEKHSEWWNFLADRNPEIRARLVAEFNRETYQPWTVRRFLRPGEIGMLRPALGMISDDNSWMVDEVVHYLVTLPSEALVPHVSELLANKHLRGNAAILGVLRRAGPLPLATVLAVIASGNTSVIPVAAYGDEALPILREALNAWPTEQVMTLAPCARRLRAAAPLVFDQVLAELIGKDDHRAAVWLRTGIPLEAGMVAAYERALTAQDPALWLVGAAKALKDSKLDPSLFLARCATLPADSHGDAALIAGRYLSGKLTGQGEAVATILKASPARVLASWIAIAPPEAAVAAALAQRARDPSAAMLIGYPLARLAQRDPELWKPLLPPIIEAAQGRLDFIFAESSISKPKP